MKKILMLLLVLFCLFVTPKVEAQDYKLTKIDQEGIYFVRKGGTVPDKNGTFAIYYLGGSLAYCVDPGKRIKTEDYVAHDGFVDLPYSDEVKEKMELYGYYGRDYPGHDDVKYSMAAQSLIWQAAGVENVSFWTGKNGTGEQIDISNEINEILSLVEKHHILPNLPNNIEVDVLHETIVDDSNKALNNFEIVDNFSDGIYIKDNKLHITTKKKGVEVIRLQRKKYDDLNTIIFVGKNDSDTQPLGRLRFSDLSERELYVYTDGVHIVMHKVDENSNPIKINSIEFKIKNIETGEYLCDRYDCIFETDPTGLVFTNGVDFGTYQIEELDDKITPGYSWNSEKLVFTITEDMVKWDKDKLSYIDVNFKNNSVKANLELHKKGEKAVFKNNKVTYEEINLGDVTFDLYDNSNNHINTIVTDNDGYVKVENLKIGRYFLIERDVDGYIENPKKVEFEIKQTDSHQTRINYELTIKNTLKKGKLELSKVDSETGIGIANTITEIYNDHDELLFIKETDKNGKIVIDSLPVGKYYIKEKEANYYYQKTTELKEFEIKENNEVVKVKMTNKKLVGDLEIYKKGEDYKYQDNNIVYEKVGLENIEFEIYDTSDQLIGTIKTNDDGYAKYSNLPLGKYYVIEKTKLDNYILNDNKYSFEIKKDGNKAINAKLEINNYLKKGKLEFTKLDIDTNEGIANTIIEIYDNDNRVLLTKETDELGKIVINDLPLGNYYIIEKEANSMYQLTNERIDFVIKENDELIEKSMLNEKRIVEVPKTKTHEELVANSISIIGFLIGIGGLLNERKKAY